MSDIDSMTFEDAAAAAQQLLDSTEGDLTGPDAEQFERLVTRAREAQQVYRRDRGDELVRRLRGGEMRTEGGDSGGRTVHGPTPERGGNPPLSRGNLSPLAPSAEILQQLEEARREYRSLSLIETRSNLDTTLMGTATEYQANGLPAPRNLWRASGIPTSQPPAGYKATVPLVTLPSAVALVAEGSDHAEFDSVAPDPVQLLRTGAWSTVSAEALISSSLAEISAAHLHVISRDLDKALIAKLEQTPTGELADLDEILAEVAGETSTDTSALWIVGNAAAIAGLAGNATFAATNASDVASYATSYGGARLYISPSATNETLTVFNPSSFRAFATPLASGVVVDPKSGEQTFGQWLMWGVGQSLAGAAATVSDAYGTTI